MEAPKNSAQKFMGDTAAPDVGGSPFQRPSMVEKVVNVREQGKMPKETGVKTPGPNE